MRGRNREKTFQKKPWKAKKNFSETRPPSFLFFNLFPVVFDRFVVFTSCMLHLQVSAKKDKTLTPTWTGNFLLTSMDWEFYERRLLSILLNLHNSSYYTQPYSVIVNTHIAKAENQFEAYEHKTVIVRHKKATAFMAIRGSNK